MDDFQKVTELIKQEYHLENITPISHINQENIESFIAVVNPKIVNREFLLDPANKDKCLIQFRDLKKNKRIEIITADKKAINKAMEYKSYLNQPIGISIHATCVAMGSGSSDMRISHIDRLIPSLNEVFGWKFKLIDRTGSFNADIKIDSTSRIKADQALDKLQRFLDALAITKNVGFHIQHYSVTPIPRHTGPHWGGWGPTEHMIPPLNDQEVENIINIISSNDKVIYAVRGLNQAYIENLLPSRVARLWATVEHVLDSKPTQMLKKSERKAIIQTIKKMEILEDSKIKKINEVISNLYTESRNERIAKNISILLKIPFEEAYDKIRKASKDRGKNVHEIRDDWELLKESEKFLQEVLLRFIDKNSKKENIKRLKYRKKRN